MTTHKRWPMIQSRILGSVSQLSAQLWLLELDMVEGLAHGVKDIRATRSTRGETDSDCGSNPISSNLPKGLARRADRGPVWIQRSGQIKFDVLTIYIVHPNCYSKPIRYLMIVPMCRCIPTLTRAMSSYTHPTLLYNTMARHSAEVGPMSTKLVRCSCFSRGLP